MTLVRLLNLTLTLDSCPTLNLTLEQRRSKKFKSNHNPEKAVSNTGQIGQAHNNVSLFCVLSISRNIFASCKILTFYGLTLLTLTTVLQEEAARRPSLTLTLPNHDKVISDAGQADE